jgi:hypothetical protein
MTTGINNSRGIASLEFKGRVLRFRTNPNEIWWSYGLNTAVENTYGGRVVQILGANIEDLVVKVECGRGGWPYLMQVVNFMRDMINDQRAKADPGLFTYTTRNWRLKVWAASVPFQDSVTATTREIELRFKVQEDVSGVQTSMSIASELKRLQDGIGFKKNEFNTGPGALGQVNDLIPGSPLSTSDSLSNLIPGANSLFGAAASLGIPVS